MKHLLEFLKKHDKFLVVGHYDADGIASTGLMLSILKKLNKEFRSMIVKSLSEESLKQISELGEKTIFVDLGSGYTNEIKDCMDEEDFMILDHHEPKGDCKYHFNAILQGLDGTNEISGAGCVYLLAKELGYKELSKIAIVGAVGDNQDPLRGFNREVILKDAIFERLVFVKKDISLFGKFSRPLLQFLMYSMDPFIPGISGNEEGVKEFLKKLNIPLKNNEHWRRYADLSFEEKKQLITGLYIHGLKQGVKEHVLKRLVGEVYEFENEVDMLKDAKEFATVLNACGRWGQPEIGIMLCLGDRGKYLKKAENIVRKHREELRKALDWAVNNVEEKEGFYLIDGRGIIGDNIIGIVCSMLYGSYINPDKPVVGLALDKKRVKVSARATRGLVEKGLDLGVCMGEFGGGHKVAAGATVDSEKLDEFIKKLEREIKKQLGERL